MHSELIIVERFVCFFPNIQNRSSNLIAFCFFHPFLLIHKPVGASHKLVYIFNAAHSTVRAAEAYGYIVGLSGSAVELVDLCLYFTDKSWQFTLFVFVIWYGKYKFISAETRIYAVVPAACFYGVCDCLYCYVTFGVTVGVVDFFKPIHITGYKDNVALFVFRHKLSHTFKISASVIDICQRIYRVSQWQIVVCLSEQIFYAEVFKCLVYRFDQSLNIVEAARIYQKVVCNCGVIAYDLLLKMQRAEHYSIVSFDQIVEVRKQLFWLILQFIAVILPYSDDMGNHFFGKNAVICLRYNRGVGSKKIIIET